MIVKLFDRTEIAVSQAEAAAAASAIERNVEVITLQGCLIRTKAIAAIMSGGYTEADRTDKSHRLAARTDHRGEYSPALERLRAHFAAKKVGNFTHDKQK